jgi:uncharacterized repeat protein (TIGR01451 family)
MTIVLSDIPASVPDYIEQNVTIDVTTPRTGTSNVLQPGDDATFDVTLTNKGPIRLVNIQYHLTINDSTVAQFLSTGSALLPSRADFGDPVLTGGVQTPTLLISPLELSGLTILEPNGSDVTFRELSIHLRKKGSAEIKVHIHADIDLASVFPNTQRGNATAVDIQVK